VKKLRFELPETLAHDVASASEPDRIERTAELVRASALDQQPVPAPALASQATVFRN
jgi:hypothetical protein